MLKQLKIAAAIVLLGLSTTSKADIVELALLLDGSGSVGSSGWSLQKSAYQNIFTTGSFYTDFVVGGDTLVVSAFTFSNSVVQSIGWTEINNDAQANAFGLNFGSLSFPASVTRTDLAVNTATSSILSNGWDGDRLIIDISTDGVPYGSGTTMATTIAAIANAAALGVTTNLIGVGSGINLSQLNQLANAGSNDGFVKTAPNFASFQTSLEEKLFREIQGVPTPGSFLLMFMGLIGLIAGRARG